MLAQLDSAVGMVDSVLKANAAQATGTISIDRAMLEQIKSQLEQVRTNLRKQ
jgi:hypothetical protein